MVGKICIGGGIDGTRGLDAPMAKSPLPNGEGEGVRFVAKSGANCCWRARAINSHTHMTAVHRIEGEERKLPVYVQERKLIERAVG